MMPPDLVSVWFEAVRSNDASVTQLCCIPGLITATDDNGRTALHIAAHNGHDKLVGEFLTMNPRLADMVACDGWTALQHAAHNGHEKIVGQILSVRPNVINTTAGLTALHIAAVRGHDLVVARLLASGSWLFGATSNGYTVLHHAAENGHNHIVARLLRAGGESVSAIRSVRGLTPLHCAARRGQELVVELLLPTSPLAAVDQDGKTALSYAITHGHKNIVEKLLSVEPELIDIVDKGENTCLHLAIGANSAQVDLAELLFHMKPAALRAVNKSSQTPFDLAVLSDHPQKIDLLQWSLSFGEIMSAFATRGLSCERYRPVIGKQCESLALKLGQDLMGIV